MQNKKGFTLIELLVVIAIIGILSAIGLTALSGAQSKARDTKRKADLGALNSSLTIYIDSNSYPLQVAPALASTALSTAAASTTNGFAIPKTPTGTGTVADYWYQTDNETTATMFGLYTKLENTVSGDASTWFVSNSRGFSDVVHDTAAGVNYDTANVPTASTSVCVAAVPASPSANALYPCSSSPIM